MRVNILEDNLHQQARVERCLRKAQQGTKFRIEDLFVGSQPKEFLEQAELMGTRQLYLLDIEIEGESKTRGLEVAQQIRKFDEFGEIIFVTTHENFAQVTYKYKVNTLGFISKEVSDEVLVEDLRDYLIHISEKEQNPKDEELITLGRQGNMVSFYPYQFLFASSMGDRKVKIVTTNSRAVIREKISTIVHLDENFVQAMRAIVVNQKNIFRIDKKAQLIHFENGEYCEVSRRNANKLNRYLYENT